MGIRAVFFVLLCALTGARADSIAYLRGERFASSPRNWVKSNPDLFYGQEVTKVTGNKGAAGGLFQPIPPFNYYADLYLGGAFPRSRPLSANGKLALQQASGVPPFDATVYVGHFAQKLGSYIQTVGIAFTGQGAGSVFCEPIIEFANGAAYVGEGFELPVGKDTKVLSWSYSWDPSAGFYGQGLVTIEVDGNPSQIDVPPSAAGANFTVDAFGLFVPPFTNINSTSYIQLYIGDVAYSAFVGNPPRIKIDGPHRIRTSDAEVSLRGTAKVTIGNKIKVIKYRVIRDGRRGHYKKADGTTHWSADIRVPRGSSRIEILARSDSGLVTTEVLRVKR